MAPVKRIFKREDGTKLEYYEIAKSAKGIPRYLTHYLNIAPTMSQAIKLLHGRKYKNDFVVFDTYSVTERLKNVCSVQKEMAR